MVTTVIVILVGALFGFIFDGGVAKPFLSASKENKGWAYFVCILVVLAVSVLFGLIAAAPVEIGDELPNNQVAITYRPPMSLEKRDALITNTFGLLLIPALFAVWLFLRQKAND